MSNLISTVAAREFLGHIFWESLNERLSTPEEFETSCKAFPKYEINDVDQYGNTALHIAAACGNVFLINTIFQKAQGLLDRPNIYGQTPLCKAILNNRLEAAEALLECGASVNILAKGVRSYCDRMFFAEDNFALYDENMLSTEMSLLALAVDRMRKCRDSDPEVLISSNIVQLLLQYDVTQEDSDTLAKQVISYNGFNKPQYFDVFTRWYSKLCSSIMREASESVTKKRESIVTTILDFLPKDVAHLVVEHVYIK